MKRRAFVVVLSLCLIVRAAVAAAPWHQSFYLANQGYWPERVAISIENGTSDPLMGKPVTVSLPALAGARVESLRVCRADGVELLFDLRDVQGSAKRTGPLAADDRMMIPAECAAQGAAIVYVYAGNDSAWAVPDFLAADFTGGARNPGQTSAHDDKSIQTNSLAGAQEPGLKLRVTVGAVERLPVKVIQNARRKQGPEWQDWAEVQVRNLGETRIAPALVRVNLRMALARLPGIPSDAATRVAFGEGTELAAYRLGRGADLLFKTELDALTERTFQVGFSREATSGATAALKDYEQLLASDANLVPNGSFERGSDTPEFWSKPESGRKQTSAGFGTDAGFGGRCLELVVGENSKADWLGWHSREIPVQPGATYFLSGWLKAVGLKGSATIHAHFHDASGALTKSGAMIGTQPNVSGDSDWTNSNGFFQAPPDAATLQIHLTMNTEGTLRHDGIALCRVMDGEVVRVQREAAEAPTAGIQVWEVNSLVKVFPDTPAQDPARAVAVELARNESEPFQLALRQGSGPTSRVEVAVSTLKNAEGDTLPPVKIERVGFVPIDYPSAYYSTDVAEWCRKVPRGSGATDGWTGWWPDPLVPGNSFDLLANQTQPVWFTVHSRKDAVPGDYRGEVTFRAGGGNAVTIPLTVRVLPFALPDRTRLQVIFDFRFGPGGVFGSGAKTTEERQRWLRFLADHRLGVDGIEPAPKFSYKDGTVTMDASGFDEAARFCFDELGMSVAYTPSFFYMFGWAYPPKKFFGLEPFTPAWTSAFKQAYRLFSDHVREKGWHDKFVYYVSDEPHFQQGFVVEQMKKLCALIHEVDPQIPIYSSTWNHCAAWDDSLDLWGIGQYGCFPVAEIERLHKAGKQMWFTCDGQMATDTPFLATERMLPYYCFRYGVKGFEFWGLAWWTYNPWQIGWHQFIRQSDEGKKYYWVRYPDGDGYLAYPGKPVGVDGPVSTIRLEQVREGLEDYEAMAMLAELAQKARQGGQPSAVAERAVEMARALVTIPNAGGLRSTEILPNPERIHAIRRAVNAALVELLR
jgi:hypothetical protein